MWVEIVNSEGKVFFLPLEGMIVELADVWTPPDLKKKGGLKEQYVPGIVVKWTTTAAYPETLKSPPYQFRLTDPGVAGLLARLRASTLRIPPPF